MGKMMTSQEHDQAVYHKAAKYPSRWASVTRFAVGRARASFVLSTVFSAVFSAVTLCLSGALTLTSILSPAVEAQDLRRVGGAIERSLPSLAACIQTPTRKCALESAVETAIQETTGGEQARVLIGVARSLIDIGDLERARGTLSLALDRSKAQGLTIIVQDISVQVAPLMARAGNREGALEIASSIQYPNLRDRAMIGIAREAFAVGDVASARRALKTIKRQKRARWEELRGLARAPKGTAFDVDYSALRAEIDKAGRGDRITLGVAYLAAIAFAKDDQARFQDYLDEINRLYERLVSSQIKMIVEGQLVDVFNAAGVPDNITEAFYAAGALRARSAPSGDDLIRFSRSVASYEGRTGRGSDAIKRAGRVAVIKDLLPLAADLTGIPQDSEVDTILAKQLQQIIDMDSRFVRDRARLDLLEGMVSSGLLGSSLEILESIEDDDSLAYGVARLAPILPN